jgi:hypothetical protein
VRTWLGPETGETAARDGRAVRPCFVPATLPAAWGWAWTSVAGSTGRGRLVTPLCSTSSSAIWKSCCSSGPPALSGSTGPCAPWWRGPARVPQVRSPRARLRAAVVRGVSKERARRLLLPGPLLLPFLREEEAAPLGRMAARGAARPRGSPSPRARHPAPAAAIVSPPA